MKITNEDNMTLMSRFPDNHFDWAIVDPEYGIGADNPSVKQAFVKQKNGSKIAINQKKHKKKNWDSKPPEKKYFDELFRVSKNQIIWGVNYFNYNFGVGRLVWNKLNGDADQYGCEIAFNSVNNRTDIVNYLWAGMMQGRTPSTNASVASVQKGNKKNNEKRIHPTQKPVLLYEWILDKYAKEGDKILDTNLGSGSIAIACHNRRLDLTACELDEEYYNDAIKRIDLHKRQLTLF